MREEKNYIFEVFFTSMWKLRQKLLMEQFWKPMFSLVTLLTDAILQMSFFFFAFPCYFNLHSLMSGIFLKAQYLHSIFFQLLKHLYDLYFCRELKDLCWECEVSDDVRFFGLYFFSPPVSPEMNTGSIVSVLHLGMWIFVLYT